MDSDSKATHATTQCCNGKCCLLCWNKHFYHNGDAGGSRDSDAAICPMCRATITWGGIKPVHAYVKQLEKRLNPDAGAEGDDDDGDGTDKDVVDSHDIVKTDSAKVRWVLSQIREHGRTEKIAISSQWTQFLEIIIAAFKRDFPDVQHIVLTGATTRERRLSLISEFQKNESVLVCFMSSQAMSQGITLTAASRVYNMDIWWNGEMEYQIFSRLYRRGQTRPVIARTLIVHESIEKELRAPGFSS
jgi:SNF2 family DNA or RNA helicase